MTIPYEFIESAPALRRLADRLTGQPTVAVDIEADSMHHFRERVCLVQIAAEGVNAVVDTLALDGLTPLAPIFADSAVRKVFHGADYDVRSLYRDYTMEINNLFDTQLAAMYAGHTETGLEAMVKKYFDVQLDKRFQKKNWARRPLPEEMVAYAASDAIYLISLADTLTNELDDLGRLDWVQEECLYLSRVRPDTNGDDPLFLKFKGAGTLDRRGLAVLEALLAYRVEMAERKDRPPFKVFSSQSIRRLTEKRPRNMRALERSGALSRKQIDMYGADIIGRIDGAMKLAAPKLPEYPRRRAPRLPARAPERIRQIKDWRDAQAEALELDPSLLFTKAQITELAVKNPNSVERMAECELLKDWQIRAFGQELLDTTPLGQEPPPGKRRRRRRRKKK